MKMNSKIVKQNLSSLLSALAIAAVLGETRVDYHRAYLFAQTRSDVRAVNSEQQEKLAERYWKILLNNPSYGAAFEQVYRSAARKDDCAALIAELQTQRENATGATKGKRAYLLGLFFLRQDRSVDGVEVLNEAETLLPNDGAVSLTLGMGLILQGRLQEGAEALERALTKKTSDKERFEALEKLGDVYSRLGEREKAENVWKTAVELFGEDVEVLRLIADKQADAGAYRQAGELYAKLEAEAASRKDVQAEIEFAVACGDMKTRLGEKEGAIADFERALDKIAPGHWYYKSLRDRIEYAFLLRSDYEGLVDHYRERVAKRPNELDSACRLIVTLGVLGRYDEAKQVFAETKRRAPKDVLVCRSGIELALAQNDYAFADELYEELNALSPKDLEVELSWGDAALKNDKLDAEARQARVLKIWTRALNDPNAAPSELQLVADKLAENNFRPEAEKVLKKLRSMVPDDFEYCAELARFYFRGDERGAAFSTLDEFIKARAKDASAWDDRAVLLRSVGCAAEAVDAAREALALTPGDFRRALYLCDCEANVNGCASDADIKRVEELAQTDNEQEQAFAARMTYVRLHNAVGEYLASLDAELVKASPEKRADIYWKKAACALAFDDPNGAAEAALCAFEAKAVSKKLSAKIREIVAKSQAPENTLKLLNAAIKNDPDNIALYLRSRVGVCLELGSAEEAIESGKELLAYDSGMTENYRVYADVLLECGRTDEAIDVLVKASSLNSSDRASQMKLARLLEEVGKTDEALDELWELFDRAARLEEKLPLIDALSKLAAKIDRFDALKERLQTRGTTTDARRENAYCLARAYMSIKDYDSARTTLENAVAFKGARADDSGFWLNALANLAELQNDIEGAIRFQEQLCELDSGAAERNRLLELYRRLGDTERARDYLTRKILPTEPLWKRLETVDALLSLGDYPLAAAILEELDRGFPDNWEVLARRLTLAGWTNSSELPELIDKTLARKESWNARSSKSAALEYDSSAVGTTIAGDAWRVGNDDSLTGRAVLKLIEPSDYRDLVTQTLAVVYRDKLTLKEKNALSASSTVMTPQKPVPSYVNRGACVFEALAWQDRLARSDGKNIPVFDGKTEGREELLTRYLLDYYALCLAKSGVDKVDAEVETLADAVQSTALALCEYDLAWRTDAFSTVLEELENADDVKTLETKAEFLVDTLQASLDGNKLRNEANVWKRASYAANVMERKGLNDLGTRTRELVKLAGERDYAVLLSADPDDEYASFETFAANWANVETEVVRQTHNRSDVERARELMGAALTARLNAEIDDALADRASNARERVKSNGAIGQALCEKAVFGYSVINSFISMNRRTIFEVEPDATLTDAEIADISERIYRVLDLAVKSDARMTPVFLAKEGKRLDAGAHFTIVDALGYLERDNRTSQIMAAYLIDRTLYGRTWPQSLLESSRILEYAFGAFFSLDIASALTEPQVFSEDRFTNLEGLLEYINAHCANSADVNLQLYAAKIVETSEVFKRSAQGETASETSSELKAKALKALTELDKEGMDVGALLIALTMLALAEKDEDSALEYLERVKCVSFTEKKARELAILGAFKNTADPEMIERKEAAIATLAGSRLDESEGMRFWRYLVGEERGAEALKMRRRLEGFATSAEVVEAILDDMLVQGRNSEDPDDVDVAFALRVFKTPSTSLRDSARLEKLRAKALTALNFAGKLNETLERMETRSANAPGSYELVLRLADVKIEIGDAEGAKGLLKSLADRKLNDTNILYDLASGLARVNETLDAKRILREVYTRKPEEFFKGETPEYWTAEDDVAFIAGLSCESVAPYAFKAFSTLLDALRRVKSGELTLDAEQIYAAAFRLWDCVDAESTVRETLRSSGSRVFVQSGDRRFFTALSEYVLEAVALNEKPNESYPAYQDVHRIIWWNDRDPKTLSIMFLELADKEENEAELTALLEKVKTVCAEHSKRPEESPARHSAALTLQVEILLKLGALDDALEALSEAEKYESFCAKEFTNDPLTICLAFEYFVDDAARVKAADTLLAYYLKSYAVNTHFVYEPFHIAHIYSLGMSVSNAETNEKYTALAAKRLQELFRLAANADLGTDRRIAGTSETCDTITFYSQVFLEAFERAGKLDVVKEILRETGLHDRLDASGEGVIPCWTALFESLKTKLGE